MEWDFLASSLDMVLFYGVSRKMDGALSDDCRAGMLSEKKKKNAVRKLCLSAPSQKLDQNSLTWMGSFDFLACFENKASSAVGRVSNRMQLLYSTVQSGSITRIWNRVRADNCGVRCTARPVAAP